MAIVYYAARPSYIPADILTQHSDGTYTLATEGRSLIVDHGPVLFTSWADCVAFLSGCEWHGRIGRYRFVDFQRFEKLEQALGFLGLREMEAALAPPVVAPADQLKQAPEAIVIADEPSTMSLQETITEAVETNNQAISAQSTPSLIGRVVKR